MKKNLIEECYNEAHINLDIANNDKWKNSKHESIKRASTTAKGNFGQELTSLVLNKIGYKADVIDGGIGDFDILLYDLDIRIEHKLATQDTNNKFQFNAIDKDKKYDYVFCLGITPEDIYFDVVSKNWIINNVTTHMTKAEGGYKMTKSLPNLQAFNKKNILAWLKSLEKK